MITGLSLHIPLPFTGLSIIGLLMSKPETAITIYEQYTVDLTEMMTAMPEVRHFHGHATKRGAERICGADQNGDNLPVNRTYLRISVTVRVRVRVRLW